MPRRPARSCTRTRAAFQPPQVEPPSAGAVARVGRYVALRALELVGIYIPFADALAELLPARAVRMRRDFRQLLTVVETCALLHIAQRQTTADGWLVATLDQDYRTAPSGSARADFRHARRGRTHMRRCAQQWRRSALPKSMSASASLPNVSGFHRRPRAGASIAPCGADGWSTTHRRALARVVCDMASRFPKTRRCCRPSSKSTIGINNLATSRARCIRRPRATGNRHLTTYLTIQRVR